MRVVAVPPAAGTGAGVAGTGVGAIVGDAAAGP